MRELPYELERQRVAWWLVGAALLFVLFTFVRAFVDVFALGLFAYYGSRPVHRRFLDRFDSRGVAATLTMLVIVLPALCLLGYGVVVAFREFTAVVGTDVVRQLFRTLPFEAESVTAALHRPLTFLATLENLGRLRQQLQAGFHTLGRVSAALVHLTLSLAFTFFLLRDGDRVERWFRKQVAGDGTVPHAYFSAVDADLETVYFGNVVTVLLVAGLAVLVYNGFNLLAPPAVHLPFPTLLALLTGLATFVPLVVGKLVYVPAAGYLAWEALRADASLLPVAFVFLAVSFVLLDLLPQAVLRPIISGRELHSGLVLFSYVLGAAYFGWYGLFLGPLLAVLVVQFVKVVFPELLHGDDLTPDPSHVLHIGHDPEDGIEGDHGRAAAEDSDSALEEDATE